MSEDVYKTHIRLPVEAGAMDTLNGVHLRGRLPVHQSVTPENSAELQKRLARLGIDPKNLGDVHIYYDGVLCEVVKVLNGGFQLCISMNGKELLVSPFNTDISAAKKSQD